MICDVSLEDLQAFFLVVETGSFARAADRMGVAKSIVSRRVSSLETALKARLLTRTARGTQATDVGLIYYEKAREALAQLEAAQEAVAEAVYEVAGPIMLSAPLSFGVTHLSKVLAEFAATYPRVELDIGFDDRRVDVLGGGYDLVVRIGEMGDSALVARRIGLINAVLVASPDYLARAGRPENLAALNGREGLIYTNVSQGDIWRFGETSVKMRSRLRSDSGEMLLCAAVAGLGIAILPGFIAAKAIADGTLEVLLPEQAMTSPLQAVMPPGRAKTARVRALVDYLALRFSGEVL
ncbi:MAG: LysR family transcriptional regulator [Asticcacaulis sp.]